VATPVATTCRDLSTRPFGRPSRVSRRFWARVDERFDWFGGDDDETTWSPALWCTTDQPRGRRLGCLSHLYTATRCSGRISRGRRLRSLGLDPPASTPSTIAFDDGSPSALVVLQRQGLAPGSRCPAYNVTGFNSPRTLAGELIPLPDFARSPDEPYSTGLRDNHWDW